jgi:hypothetical protein
MLQNRLKMFIRILFEHYILNYFSCFKLILNNKIDKLICLKLNNKKDILENYYIDLITLSSINRFTDLILIKERRIYVKYANLGAQYNPLSETLCALQFYQKRNHKIFLYLVKNVTEKTSLLYVKQGKEIALWYYDFPFPPRAYNRHWVSGMMQGVIASLYARAYYLTKNELYKDLCIKTIDGMLTFIEDGGTLYKNKGYLWIEEYPTEKPLTHVLNGFIFALLGLYDAYLITNNEKYLNFFKIFIKVLKNNLMKYDLIFWSKYDVFQIAEPSYHLLHVLLLLSLYRLTHDIVLKNVALRWLHGFKVLPLPFIVISFIFNNSRRLKARQMNVNIYSLGYSEI